MATTNTRIVFSDDGDYLAFSSSDGLLRIFESATGVLKQEFTSSSHLSTATTALSWSRQEKHKDATPKAKRRKTNKVTPEVYQDDLMLIALGTTSGTVNLYSFAKGQLHTQLTDGHSSKVNDLCWHLSSPELFSCSDDQTVVQWDLLSGSVKRKWRCGSSEIQSVSHCSQNCLLTASHIIKLWDISTKTILQKFTGHTSPVFQLLPVWLNSSNDDEGSSYVLSTAFDDRHVNVWYCGSSADKNSLVTFSVPDEVASIFLSRAPVTTQSLLLAVVTSKGFVHIFEHTFNGKKKKPLLCKVTIQAVSTTGGGVDGASVPIHSCYIQDDRILLAVGNQFKPQFETWMYDSTQKEVTISVAEPVTSLMTEEYSQVKKPEISEHVTTLTSADSQPQMASKNRNKMRHRKLSVSDLTVEERLNAMSSDAPKNWDSTNKPVTNTLSKLLRQGLLSEDSAILRDVFQDCNETVVRNTVKMLPLPFIVPLLEQIEKGMNGHSQSAFHLSRWTAAIIACHTSYILSVPDVIRKMNHLHQTLLARQRFYPKMLELKGRLDLVKRQNQSQDAEDSKMNAEPLLVHQDDSDDSDSMAIDGPVLESDENWEDLSDME